MRPASASRVVSRRAEVRFGRRAAVGLDEGGPRLGEAPMTLRDAGVRSSDGDSCRSSSECIPGGAQQRDGATARVDETRITPWDADASRNPTLASLFARVRSQRSAAAGRRESAPWKGEAPMTPASASRAVSQLAEVRCGRRAAAGRDEGAPQLEEARMTPRGADVRRAFLESCRSSPECGSDDAQIEGTDLLLALRRRP